MEFTNNMSVTTSDGYTRILVRWTKGVHDRIYINGGSRSGDGYVDLVDRSTHLYGGLNYQKEIAQMILDMFPEESYEPSSERLMVLAYRDLRTALEKDLQANGENVRALEDWVLETIYKAITMGTQKCASRLANNKKYPAFVKACAAHDVKVEIDYSKYIDACY